MIDITISRLLGQAGRVATNQTQSSIHVTYSAIFITPGGSINSLGVVGKAERGDFAAEHAEDMTLRVRLQPSTYTDYIIPYRDNLMVQLVSSDANNRVVKEYTAIPLTPGDPKTTGSHSGLADLTGVSALTFQVYDFQLLDPLYTTLKDQIVSGITMMGKVDTTISYLLDAYTKQYATNENYQGIVMEYPVDNDQTYSVIVVPEGTSLPSLPNFIQNSEKYGVYSKGLGCFFKQGRWWIYTLFDVTRFDRHPSPIDIYRLPSDKIPTLDKTFFVNDNGLTILATGDCEYNDQGDISRQESGLGARLILSSKVAGETGSYYNAGRSIQTRADSMAEFQVTQRASGDDYTPVVRTPTSNPYKYASAVSANEGIIVTLEWQNSDTGFIEPGCPCRYLVVDETSMTPRKGVVLGYRTDYRVIDNQTLTMKRSTRLTLFIENIKE